MFSLLGKGANNARWICDVVVSLLTDECIVIVDKLVDLRDYGSLHLGTELLTEHSSLLLRLLGMRINRTVFTGASHG